MIDYKRNKRSVFHKNISVNRARFFTLQADSGIRK